MLLYVSAWSLMVLFVQVSHHPQKHSGSVSSAVEEKWCYCIHKKSSCFQWSSSMLTMQYDWLSLVMDMRWSASCFSASYDRTRCVPVLFCTPCWYCFTLRISWKKSCRSPPNCRCNTISHSEKMGNEIKRELLSKIGFSIAHFNQSENLSVVISLVEEQTRTNRGIEQKRETAAGATIVNKNQTYHTTKSFSQITLISVDYIYNLC